jgi:hypothetical protein
MEQEQKNIQAWCERGVNLPSIMINGKDILPKTMTYWSIMVIIVVILFLYIMWPNLFPRN